MPFPKYNNFLCDLEQNVLTITINRSEKLNPINLESLKELKDILTKTRENPDVHALVITGAGEKAFCTGGDVNELYSLNPLEARAYSRLGKKVFTSLSILGRPVIAAVNGFAISGGLEIVLACDIAFASESAQFGHPEINFALIPTWGGTQRLTRLVGTMRAKELIFGGRLIGPDEALKIGLINRIVPMDRLLIEAQNFARDISQKSLTALRLAKQAINSASETDITTGMALESSLFALCFTNKEVRKLINDFIKHENKEM
ncbi:MAG: enoyl-CoA hydratase/isomerase family protein [Candidatus Ranarchaeia archaeon]